jgi:hypothetical protein
VTTFSIVNEPRHRVSLQPRLRILAAFELADRPFGDAALLERWLASAPLSLEVEPNQEVVFGSAVSADGVRRRYTLDAGASAYLKPALALFDALGVDPDAVRAVRQLVEDAGVARLGTWVDEGEDRATFGWSLPSGLLLDTALALAPDSDARKVVSTWARKEGAAFVRRFEHAVGPRAMDGELAQVVIPLGAFETALGAAQRAFETVGAPWPEEVVDATLAVFSPTSLELTLTLTPDGVERIGLIAPAPSRELVLAACDLLSDDAEAGDERLAHYEAVLGAAAPEAVELAIGRDGFEVLVHLSVSC